MEYYLDYDINKTDIQFDETVSAKFAHYRLPPNSVNIPAVAFFPTGKRKQN